MQIQAKANLEALIESTEDLIWSVDPHLRLITFNRAFKEHFEKNFGGQVAPGIGLAELLPAALAVYWPPLYGRALRGEKFSSELLLVDGRMLELSFSPIVVRGETTGVSVFGKNITERKRAEGALQEAKANLSTLIESTEDLIWSVDLDFRLVTFNSALRKNIFETLGVDLELGMRFHELLPPERSVLWLPFYQRVIAQGPFRVEYPLIKPRILELSFNPIVVDGATTGISVFGKDITERKRAEAELRESGDFLREAQRIGDLGCYVLDVSTGIWTSTSRLDEIFGIDASYERSVAGWEALVHPDDWAMMSAYFANQVIGENKPFDKEYRIIRRSDGAARWVRGLGKLEFDAEGHPLKLRGIISDITAHREWEMALKSSEERYRTIFLTSPDAVMLTQFSDGEIIDANQSFLDSSGHERSDVIGSTALKLGIWVNESDRENFIDFLRKNSVCRNLEVLSRKKDGEIFWMRVSASLVEVGGIQCVLSFAQDITEAKAAAEQLAVAVEALRTSEDRYRTAFQTSIDAININRLSDGQYIDCNQAFLDFLGYERDEVIGRGSLELEIWADSRDRQAMTKILRQNGSCRNMESRFRRKNGEIIWGEMSASLMDVDGVPCILSVTRDLSPAKAAEKEIRNLAFYDPLTGLPNRRHLLDKLRQALASSAGRGRSQALLLIDLDNFKKLNDTLGHQTGDVFLQEIARRIQECVHEADSVCRVGGDSFIVMLEDLSEAAEEAAAEAQAVGEKILTLIGRPCMIEERECLSSASIGITIFGDRQCSTDEIMQQTDIALYQAKAAGRNTMRFFSPALQSAVNARATLEDDLRRAIKAKQFILFYQPQVERGRLTGAEVLIRWQHPTRGMVRPDEFIRSAEDSGLILPMGDWVLEAACAQIASWAGREETAHLSLSVNISALQFRQPEFTEQVLATLERTGANPRDLKLELTESMLVDNFEEVIQKMTELKSHGLSFSLDDFGTGYSSLAYLKRLPLDQLKIDRAFVRDMLMDASSGAIAQAILSLGRAMNLSVVAEGVETEEQRSFLTDLGCHCFQGFLFSQPLPVDEFELFLRGFAESAIL
jgi:diguanylate cyclase (GGDEF)-like protein/PAS domain S-box-containing protein